MIATDTLIDWANTDEVRARIRAIVLHRRHPDRCDGHNGRLALHYTSLTRSEERVIDRYIADDLSYGVVRDIEDHRVQ